MKVQVLHLAVYCNDNQPDPETWAWRNVMPGAMISVSADPVLHFPAPSLERPALDTYWSDEWGHCCKFTFAGMDVEVTCIPDSYEVFATFGSFTHAPVADPRRFGYLPVFKNDLSVWLRWCQAFSVGGLTNGDR